MKYTMPGTPTEVNGRHASASATEVSCDGCLSVHACREGVAKSLARLGGRQRVFYGLHSKLESGIRACGSVLATRAKWKCV